VVLNNVSLARHVPHATKLRIKQVAKNLGYQPNHFAQYLRKHRSETVGVMMFDIADSYCAQILKGVENALYRSGYLALMADVQNGRERFQQYVDMLLRRRFEGLLALANSIYIEVDLLDAFENRKTPYVIIGREFETKSTSWVAIDNEGGTYAAMNHLYAIALAAAAAEKIVLCEKPLARNLAEARDMARAVEESGRPSMVRFNYRRVPANSLAKQIIDGGTLGKIYHYRATDLQDWGMSSKLVVGGKLGWRFDKDLAGGGASVDAASHMIDTALWLNGPLARICAMTETFQAQRPGPDGSPKPVKVDDVCAFLARFANGSNGTFETTRFARGRKNENAFEVNGEKGALSFNPGEMHQQSYFEHDAPPQLRGWRTINVTASEHPYMANWWVPGCVIGYEHTFVNALADFLKALEKDERVHPDFRDALDTQAVVEAVLESARTGPWLSPEAAAP
jgi:predicted dehydrogenase